MDIYFCDLCGVRVTDIDLKGGHGLRSGHDVICATCLELGHGKEWLAKRQAQLKPTPSPGSGRQDKPALAAAAAGEPRQSAAALLDRARDRARTAEEDQTPAVGVQVLASESDGEEDLAHAEHSELEQESGAHAELKPAENQSTNLAAAASSFSALGASPVAKDKDAGHADDDLDDHEDDGGSETQAVAPEEKAAAPAQPAAEEVAGESPFSFKGAPDKAAAGKAAADKATPFDADDGDEAERKVNPKDETLPTDRPPPTRPEAKAPSGITAATKRSSAKNSKIKSPKSSGRARPGKKANNKAVIILSCITLPFLLIMIYLTVMRGSGGHRPGKVEKINISEELRKSIADARLDATSALQASPKTRAKLEAARDKIQAVRIKIDDFEAQAKSKGFSDDDVIRAIEGVHWQDVAALVKNLNEEMVKLGEH